MNDKYIVRELAKETLEYANSTLMNERRKLWTQHNSLNFTHPPIYIRAIPFDEFFDEKELKCTSPYYRTLEKSFLLNRYRMQLADDYIIEPFLIVRADVKTSKDGVYGLKADLSENILGNAAAYNPSIIDEEDIEKLHVLDYEVDEEKTQGRSDILIDAVGDILDVTIDRQGALCAMWSNDISTLLAKLRGLEQLMWDVYDRPEWLHRLISYMQSKILCHIDQTQNANAFRLINHQNQAMPYAKELQPPSSDDYPVTTNELWCFMAAQEFTSFGPDFFKEFIFNYQKPIIERYALSAYGCCEDLTLKIEILKELKNLRRIAVSPFSDVKKCAEQIGKDYIASWRPNPSSAVSRGVDEEFVRKNLQDNFAIFDSNNCAFDITLKDVETVRGDKSALIKWTQIVREEIHKHYD